MFCGQCGTKLPDHAAFCPACGAAQNPGSDKPKPQNAGNKHKILAVVVMLALVLGVVGIIGISGGKKTFWDRFEHSMEAADVEKEMGKPHAVEHDDYIYYDVEFCGLDGVLEVNFDSDGKVYWVEWDYNTGDLAVNDFAKDTQKMRDYFTKKLGEGGFLTYSNGVVDKGAYCWREYETGGARYVLDIGSYRNVIRAWIDFKP